MKVFVYIKSGNFLGSDEWEFTFHGLSLEGRIEQFMMEESYLCCKSKTNTTNFKYIPFHYIIEIEEEGGQ